VKPLGAHADTIETYIEVPFLLGKRKLYPDGLANISPSLQGFRRDSWCQR
jgi:hypothetical protein